MKVWMFLQRFLFSLCVITAHVSVRDISCIVKLRENHWAVPLGHGQGRIATSRRANSRTPIQTLQVVVAAGGRASSERTTTLWGECCFVGSFFLFPLSFHPGPPVCSLLWGDFLCSARLGWVIKRAGTQVWVVREACPASFLCWPRPSCTKASECR